jgi:mannose-6-phosphate isomerase-like protein (cupin superfamily)
MKMFKANQLSGRCAAHVFEEVIPGQFFCQGGLAFSAPGERSHTNDGPGGRDCHVHAEDQEVFFLIQGAGEIEIKGDRTPVRAGDIIVIEPGEDHHLISSTDNPLVVLWGHAGNQRHKNQRQDNRVG